MSCRKCPHHVRHGQASEDGQGIQFFDRCGLQMKKVEDSILEGNKIELDLECAEVPFESGYDYITCGTYIDTFKSVGIKNGVVPTSDLQFSNKLAGSPITDMELL